MEVGFVGERAVVIKRECTLGSKSADDMLDSHLDGVLSDLVSANLAYSPERTTIAIALKVPLNYISRGNVGPVEPGREVRIANLVGAIGMPDEERLSIASSCRIRSDCGGAPSSPGKRRRSPMAALMRPDDGRPATGVAALISMVSARSPSVTAAWPPSRMTMRSRSEATALRPRGPLYYASRSLLPEKTRAFADFVVEAFKLQRLAQKFAETWG